MYCYICKRPLLRASATVTTADGMGHAGPTCARRAGLLPPRAARVFAVRRRVRVDRAQMEIAA